MFGFFSCGYQYAGRSIMMSYFQDLEVTIWRDGMDYQQKYSRGKPVTTLTAQLLPPELKDHQGTRIRFWPDKEGFP